MIQLLTIGLIAISFCAIAHPVRADNGPFTDLEALREFLSSPMPADIGQVEYREATASKSTNLTSLELSKLRGKVWDFIRTSRVEKSASQDELNFLRTALLDKMSDQKKWLLGQLLAESASYAYGTNQCRTFRKAVALWDSIQQGSADANGALSCDKCAASWPECSYYAPRNALDRDMVSMLLMQWSLNLTGGFHPCSADSIDIADSLHRLAMGRIPLVYKPKKSEDLRTLLRGTYISEAYTRGSYLKDKKTDPDRIMLSAIIVPHSQGENDFFAIEPWNSLYNSTQMTATLYHASIDLSDPDNKNGRKKSQDTQYVSSASVANDQLELTWDPKTFQADIEIRGYRAKISPFKSATDLQRQIAARWQSVVQ